MHNSWAIISFIRRQVRQLLLRSNVAERMLWGRILSEGLTGGDGLEDLELRATSLLNSTYSTQLRVLIGSGPTGS